MAPHPNPHIECLVQDLEAVADPADRFTEEREISEQVTAAMRGVRQRIAIELHDSGKSWREVGQIMGGVSLQRAHQISRGE